MSLYLFREEITTSSLCSFLKILILLVKDFSTIYKSFLPSILSFALRQMYPILAPVSASCTVIICENLCKHVQPLFIRAKAIMVF